MESRHSTAPLFLLLVALVLVPLLAGPACAQGNRHHIQLGIGFQKYLSNDLKDEASGMDFSNAALGVLAYRFSLTPNLDLVFDSRATTSTENAGGTDLTMTNYFAGPGVRLTTEPGKVRYYGQMNLLGVTEKLSWEESGLEFSQSKSDVGFGLMGGADIRASRLLSVPIEAGFLYGKPADDLSAFHVSAGLTFNFGQLR